MDAKIDMLQRAGAMGKAPPRARRLIVESDDDAMDEDEVDIDMVSIILFGM